MLPYNSWGSVKPQDVNLSISLFLDNMNSILHEHASLKQVNKYTLKFKSEPWITPACHSEIYQCQKQPKKMY